MYVRDSKVLIKETTLGCYIINIMLPAVIRNAPNNTLIVTFSPRIIKAKSMVMGTLSLSMGATLDKAPVWRALK